MAVREGELEHIIIPGARLKPDGRHPNLLRLLQNPNGDSRVRDDGHSRVSGALQGREIGFGRVVLAGDGDGGRRRVDWGDWQVVN